MFHYTVETNKSIQKAVESLETNLKEKKFGLQWQFDIKETLQKKGFDFSDDFIVLEVCNPKEAQNMLTQNKMVGYFLPCKMVVYDDAGTTKIGMPRLTSLIEMVEDEELKKFAADIEKNLIACIDKSI